MRQIVYAGFTGSITDYTLKADKPNQMLLLEIVDNDPIVCG
jgi:hypothetical protein